MKNRRPRAGFTWPELIVIVIAVTFLGGLMLVGTGSRGARPASRKTQCINNQHNIGIALIRFEGEKGRYPGWTNNQNPDADGLGGTETGWVFPILSYLDRSDLYNTYGPSGAAPGRQPAEHLKILVCPDDAESINSGTNMTYAVNTGLLDDTSPENPAAGVFTRQYRTSKDQVLTLPNASSISDGLATTILFAENIDAGTWTSAQEGCVGITWQQESPKAGSGFLINAQAGTAPCKLPRPSSFHAGGVVLTFCDGHTQFLSEDIDYKVYQKLMTPGGKEYQQGELLQGAY